MSRYRASGSSPRRTRHSCRSLWCVQAALAELVSCAKEGLRALSVGVGLGGAAHTRAGRRGGRCHRAVDAEVRGQPRLRRADEGEPDRADEPPPGRPARGGADARGIELKAADVSSPSESTPPGSSTRSACGTARPRTPPSPGSCSPTSSRAAWISTRRAVRDRRRQGAAQRDRRGPGVGLRSDLSVTRSAGAQRPRPSPERDRLTVIQRLRRAWPTTTTTARWRSCRRSPRSSSAHIPAPPPRYEKACKRRVPPPAWGSWAGSRARFRAPTRASR